MALQGAVTASSGLSSAEARSRLLSCGPNRLAEPTSSCSSAIWSTASPSSIVGDPTEAALITLAMQGGLTPRVEMARYPRVAELPFDAWRRRMTTVHVVGDGEVAYVKGSAEEIICRSELAPVERRRALRAGENMEKATLQVLALARKHVEPAAR